MARQIKPNCRYEHGELVLAEFKGIKQWALVAGATSGYTFAGKLYVCAVCGYTEFFDDEPARTVQEVREDERASSSDSAT